MVTPVSRATEGLVLDSEAQNPSPFDSSGQAQLDRARLYADQILEVFLASLPSNWVAQTTGPYYVSQFQAVAEELGRIQVQLMDAFEDTNFDFTRPEVLFQFLGNLVFPNQRNNPTIPQIDGDLTYRQFLQTMVTLLLQGSKAPVLLAGIESLTDAEVSLLEKSDFLGTPASGWGLKDRFTFEINVAKTRDTAPYTDGHYHTVSINASGNGTTVLTEALAGSDTAHVHTITNFEVQTAYLDTVHDTGSHTHQLLSSFPDLPLTLQANVALVMKALKPAHLLYDYRHLFREIWGPVFSDSWSSTMTSYYYDDLRKNWQGIQAITGTAGATLTDTTLFSDSSRSFASVSIGAPLTISSGLNAGTYTVSAILSLPFTDDSLPRPYTTSSGGSGNATVAGGVITDPVNDFGTHSAYNETITFLSGPNAGTYPILSLLGTNGGPVGVSTGPANSILTAPSLLRVFPAMTHASVSGQSYSVGVDYAGRKIPIQVTNEDVSIQFWDLTTTTFYTANGPLVRAWGDATPATPLDVTVNVHGSPVTVASLNPYTGLITLASPPSVTTGTTGVVTISYTWMQDPVMPMAGLNTPGLVLNKYDVWGGLNYASPSGLTNLGGTVTTRFPMSVVLNGTSPLQPIRIGHRFIGLERAYTAALNDPLALRLNHPPGAVSLPYANADTGSETFQYNGTEDPTTDGWGMVGSNTGSAATPLGYSLVDGSPLTQAFWAQEATLPIGTKVFVAARMNILANSPDGIFTGVGFGFHDNNRTYLAGALVVNGLQHLGILIRPGDMTSTSSWSIGPNAAGKVIASNEVLFQTNLLPTQIQSGQKFQILTGTQAGVYTVTNVSVSTDGTSTTLVTSTNFPADFTLYGNAYVTAVFHVRWDEDSSWRIMADTSEGMIELFYASALSGSFTVTSPTPTLVPPAFLGLPLGKTGQVFWGSLGLVQTNTSVWSYLRYFSTSASVMTRGQAISVGFDPIPEDDPAGWYPSSPWGVLTAVSGGSTIQTITDESYTYTHVDPTISGQWILSGQGTVSALGSMTSGAGSIGLTLRNTSRVARLGLLSFSGSPKAIVTTPTQSLDSSGSYTSQGWTSQPFTGAVSPVDPQIVREATYQTLSRSNYQSWGIIADVSTGNSKTLQVRFSTVNVTPGSDGRIGLAFGSVSTTGSTNKTFYLDFLSSPSRVVVTGDPSIAASITYAFSWDDGNPHTYQVTFDPVGLLVSLFIDGSLVGACSTALFTTTTTDSNTRVSIRSSSFVNGGSYQIRLFGFSVSEYVSTPPSRTMGIWLGGDPTNINNWAVPRTDGLTVPNSDPSSVIVSMDWTSSCQIRVSVDPTWGAVFERPDLALPSWYVDSFATQSINPTAGWVSVPYADLPVDGSRFGSISFGATDPVIATQTWENVQYQIFTNTSLNYQAPQGMILNRSNVITSGEIQKEKFPQTLWITPASPTLISFAAINIVAARVFNILVGSSLLDPTTWTFDPNLQLITLNTPLNSDTTPVQVVFAPGTPITESYLKSRPWWASPTLLNEGTPSVELGLVKQPSVPFTTSGDGFSTPYSNTPSDSNYILKDPYRVLDFGEDQTDLYESMSFSTADNGGMSGLLRPLDDGAATSSGVVTLGFSGLTYTEQPHFPVDNPYRVWEPFILTGGAAYVGSSVLAGGNPSPSTTAAFYPSWPADGVAVGADAGGLLRGVSWYLRLGSSPGSVITNATVTPPTDQPLTETFPARSDQNYATNGPAASSPSGVGSVNGAAWSSLQNLPSATSYSRLGPWTGLTDLTPTSVLDGDSSSQPYGVPATGNGFTLSGGVILPELQDPVVSIL